MERPIGRIAGDTRYDTAAALAQEGFDSADTVFVAAGATFADSLPGGAAAARQRGPLLLVERCGRPAATAAALERLAPALVIASGTAFPDGLAGGGLAGGLGIPLVLVPPCDVPPSVAELVAAIEPAHPHRLRQPDVHRAVPLTRPLTGGTSREASPAPDEWMASWWTAEAARSAERATQEPAEVRRCTR